MNCQKLFNVRVCPYSEIGRVFFARLDMLLHEEDKHVT